MLKLSVKGINVTVQAKYILHLTFCITFAHEYISAEELQKQSEAPARRVKAALCVKLSVSVALNWRSRVFDHLHPVSTKTKSCLRASRSGHR